MPAACGFRIEITPYQVVELTMQFPGQKKLGSAKTLEREALMDRVEELIKQVRTDKLSEETIMAELEAVRARRYAAWKRKAGK